MKSTCLFVTSLAVATCFACSLPADAQDSATKPVANQAEPSSRFDRKFTVTAASAHTYDALPPTAFMVDPVEHNLLNAAPVYLMAIDLLPDPKQVAEQMSAEFPQLELSDRAGPSDFMTSGVDLAGPEAETMLVMLETVFMAVEPAFERRHCAWDTALRTNGFAALLPHLSHMRYLAQSYRLRALHRAAKGDTTGALNDVRRLMILSRHIGDGEDRVLVEQLVGIGVYALAQATYRQVIEAVDTPNAYWPIAMQNAPFAVRDGLAGEAIGFYATLPMLRDPSSATPYTIGEALSRWMQFTAQMGSGDPGLAERAAGGVFVGIAARTYFAQRGMTDEQIAAIPPEQLAVRFLSETYRLPIMQAAALAKMPPYLHRAALAKLAADTASSPPASFASIVLPSLVPAVESAWRVERHRAMMQTVEAVRHHVATTGILPAALGELELAVPIDCFTGEPFGYERLEPFGLAEGAETFRLIAPAYEQEDVNSSARWTVTIRAAD